MLPVPEDNPLLNLETCTSLEEIVFVGTVSADQASSLDDYAVSMTSMTLHAQKLLLSLPHQNVVQSITFKIDLSGMMDMTQAMFEVRAAVLMVLPTLVSLKDVTVDIGIERSGHRLQKTVYVLPSRSSRLELL